MENQTTRLSISVFEYTVVFYALVNMNAYALYNYIILYFYAFITRYSPFSKKDKLWEITINGSYNIELLRQ